MTQEYRPLVEVKHLKQYFPITTGFLKTTMLKAVDDVSFTIGKGETLGLVGESGCGKTTVGRSLLHLYKPTSGEISFDGMKITKKTLDEYHRRAQMVFQDPYSSLNPRMTVGDIVAEPIDVHKLCKTRQERAERVQELLRTVGISGEQSTRYAHEFSGGQRQRIGIARALASNPEFIVCDEPVSALDVVELASSVELHHHPAHPYTVSLLSAVPMPDPDKARSSHRIVLQGDVPSPMNMPSGCAFRTRCRFATQRCAEECPQMREIAPGHFAACHNI